MDHQQPECSINGRSSISTMTVEIQQNKPLLNSSPIMEEKKMDDMDEYSSDDEKDPVVESPKNSNSDHITTTQQLEFKDFVDLQTRLVLLPRVEEEGVGAVVSSYAVVPALQETAETSTEEEHRDSAAADEKMLMGCVLIGVGTSSCNEDQTDWRNKDFTSILASIREENTPITLKFENPLAPHEEEHEEDSNRATNEASASTDNGPVATNTVEECRTEVQDSKKENEQQQPQQQQQQQPDSIQTGFSALSAWGMRMRAQSGRLAADAATSAAAMASAAKEHARVLQHQQQQQQERIGSSSPSQIITCEIFAQTSVGAYIPAKSAKQVTTSSLLMVRKSATEICPAKGFTFQWYRSSSPNLNNTGIDETASVGSGRSSKASDEGFDPDDLEWIELKGATFASFQPDATLVGRKLRCLITYDSEKANGGSSPFEDGDDSDDESEDLEDVELNSVNSVEPEELLCELPEAITADSTLFNGSRQALARGAKFVGFQGRGNAKGRQFVLDVSIGMVRRLRKPVSSLKLFQVAGDNEKIPLSEHPILQATAHAEPSNAKQFELIFQVSPDSVLSALCTDGHLQLEAPNRLTRESFLLALGIASFQGKPANLNPKTILYRDELKTFLDDASISSGSISYASSLRTSPSQKSVTLTPMFEAGPVSESPNNSVHSGLSSPGSSLSGSASGAGGSNCEDLNTVAGLQKELAFLRAKLAKKDKVVSELQRQIAHSDAICERTTKKLAICEQELNESKQENQKRQQSMQSAEKKLQSHEGRVLRIQGEHEAVVVSLENKLKSKDETIAGLEKATRALQNEKAVLTAGIEARESKLTKMGELQSSFEQLSEKVAQQDTLRLQLEESGKRYASIKEDLEQVRQLERQWKNDLNLANNKVSVLTARVKDEEKKATAALAQLKPLQKKNQQIMGERNNYKQKNDSLSKEIARLCRSGRSLKDIEKLLTDHEALQEEVETLRRQKRKALEEAHSYRTSYEQSRVAQEASGVDYESQRTLERNVELERILAEMTEYVNAKDMQLETYKQINEQLQVEIRSLAQANLDKNEV